MAYELATLAPNASATSQPTPSIREERVVSMYSSDEARYAKAMAKRADSTPKVDAPNINDSAEEQPASGASLPLSPQATALARREQKARQFEQSLKAKELALETERQEIADLKAIKAQLAVGDYSGIEKHVDYEKFAQHKIGKDPRAEELDKVNARVAAMEDAQKKDIDQRYEMAINQRKVAVKALVAGDAFPAIKEMKADDAVVQHILDTWENDNVDLSPEEAAKEVEAVLLERANKWAALVKPKETETVADKKELPPLKTTTLSNNMGSTGEVKLPTKPLHLMTEQERYQEAYRRSQEKLRQRQGF